VTAREPSWPEILDAALTARLRSVHTALPGTIRAYSEADQTATVELAVQLESTLENFAKVPDIADVPVLWPGAWADGDKCLLVFSEEDPSKWWDTDGATVEPPAVMQRHGLHASCMPFAALGGQTVDFVALAAPTKAALDKLRAAIEAVILPALDGLAPGTSAAWTAHLGGTPPPAFSSTVAASKVKAR
jgi:hypothetical protein